MAARQNIEQPNMGRCVYSAKVDDNHGKVQEKAVMIIPRLLQRIKIGFFNLSLLVCHHPPVPTSTRVIITVHV